MQRRLTSIENFAELLGVSSRTVRRMIGKGELPAYRVGGRLIRVDLNDLDRVTKRIPTAGDAA